MRYIIVRPMAGEPSLWCWIRSFPTLEAAEKFFDYYLLFADPTAKIVTRDDLTYRPTFPKNPTDN